MTLLSEKTPSINMRVRFVSENPEREPQGTLIDVGYGAVTVEWDDDHAPSSIERSRWNQLEIV